MNTEPLPELSEDTRWPRLGGLATIPGRAGIWSVWSRGTQALPESPVRPKWRRPSTIEGWWLVPVDATERERAEQAVLIKDADITQYVPVIEQVGFDFA